MNLKSFIILIVKIGNYMTFKIKILGAGSIGNHLTNAARAMGWSVDLCDIDPRALDRARTQHKQLNKPDQRRAHRAPAS